MSVSTEGWGRSAPPGNFKVLRLLLVASETLLSIVAVDRKIGKILPLKYFRRCHGVKKLKRAKKKHKHYVAEPSSNKIFLTQKFKTQIIFNVKVSDLRYTRK